MRPLHISLNTTHSKCKPSSSIYHPLLHILPKSSCPYPHISPLPPLHFYRPTPNHLHSYVPHAQTTSICYLPRLTTSATLWTLKWLYKSTLRFLTFSNTPLIHLIIIRSVLSRLSSYLHRPGFRPICQHTVDTSLVYLSLYALWCTPSCQDRR